MERRTKMYRECCGKLFSRHCLYHKRSLDHVSSPCDDYAFYQHQLVYVLMHKLSKYPTRHPLYVKQQLLLLFSLNLVFCRIEPMGFQVQFQCYDLIRTNEKRFFFDEYVPLAKTSDGTPEAAIALTNA